MLKVIQMSYSEQEEAQFSVTPYVWVLRRTPDPWEAVEGKQGRRRPQRSHLPPLKRDKGQGREPA